MVRTLFILVGFLATAATSLAISEADRKSFDDNVIDFPPVYIRYPEVDKLAGQDIKIVLSKPYNYKSFDMRSDYSNVDGYAYIGLTPQHAGIPYINIDVIQKTTGKVFAAFHISSRDAELKPQVSRPIEYKKEGNTYEITITYSLRKIPGLLYDAETLNHRAQGIFLDVNVKHVGMYDENLTREEERLRAQQ